MKPATAHKATTPQEERETMRRLFDVEDPTSDAGDTDVTDDGSGEIIVIDSDADSD